MAITIERQGQRVYLIGDTYAVKDRIKGMGGHWDGERRAWWVGVKKEAEARALVEGVANAPPKAEDPREVKVIGKAAHKGREYYIRWVGECKSGAHKARLCSLDGKIDFWVVCARPGHRPVEGEARIVKTYQEERSLGSIRRFIGDKRREEEQAKQHAVKIRTAAQGEPTRQIARVTDERIIRAFFGGRAVPYDYEVTHDDFDKYDNEGPGHYYGITVPASLADRWDAGITAAKAAGHKDMRCREALTIRWHKMAQDETAALPAELVSLLAEKAKKDEAARKVAEEKAALDTLLVGLVQSSVGPTTPTTVTPRIDGEAIPHHMASADPGTCTFGGDGMVRLTRNGGAPPV